MFWMITEDAGATMRDIYKAGVIPQASDRAAFGATDRADGSRLLTISKGVAQITIQGVLTRSPDIMAWLFGGGNTTYQEIMAAIATVENDDEVESVDFLMNSPGGDVSGLFDVIAAVEGMTKPTRAIIEGMAASACYGLSAACDEIIASSRGTWAGSVGVVVAMRVSDDMVAITSTKAPNKAPDASTEEGKAIIRERLDDIHDLFIEGIARGRGVSAETVNETFGKGALLIADKALAINMIDSIKNHSSVQATSIQNKPLGNAIMDIEELQAKEPALYKQVVNLGITQERARATSHLKVGKASGALETAIKAIEEGTNLADCQADYMVASLNKSAVDDRAQEQGETEGKPPVAAPAKPKTKTPEEEASAKEDAVLAGVLASFGVTEETEDK